MHPAPDDAQPQPQSQPEHANSREQPERRSILKGIVAASALAAGALISGNPGTVSAEPYHGNPLHNPNPHGTGERAPASSVSAGTTYFFNVPGYAFKPVNSSSTYAFAISYGAIYQTAGGEDAFIHPLFLPDGVQIVECIFYLVANDSTQATVSLNWLNPATSAGTIIGYTTTGTADYAIRAISVPLSSHTVNNKIESYFFGWTPGTVGTTNHRLYGARVGYRYAVTVPAAVRAQGSNW